MASRNYTIDSRPEWTGHTLVDETDVHSRKTRSQHDDMYKHFDDQNSMGHFFVLLAIDQRDEQHFSLPAISVCIQIVCCSEWYQFSALDRTEKHELDGGFGA